MDSPALPGSLAPAPILYGLLLLGTTWPAIQAHAAVRTVSNCNDSGAGSLRSVVSGAASGDTIDLTTLTCSRITLNGAWITVPQNDLNFVGRGRFDLTIDGGGTVRIFRHTGTGTLRITRLSLANGHYRGRGGCILSSGNVELIRARVHNCTAAGQVTSGGAIGAQGNVLLSRSSVFASTAETFGSGGGISAFSKVTLYLSQVYGNVGGGGGGIAAGAVAATYSLIHGNRGTLGGGILTGALTLNKSTLSSNRALPDPRFGNNRSAGGGAFSNSVEPILIIDSTVSGNSASGGGGLDVNDVTIINSTIAFNRDDRIDPEDNQCSGALLANRLHLESTIVARNTCGDGPDWDIGNTGFTTLTGANNLIEWSKPDVPADTILYTDPRLAPLTENGGPTRTHMLLADSPAINRGNNEFNRQFDQRGPGFPRVKGAFPDIGAIER